MTQETEIDKDLVRWSRQRWILCVVFLFTLQLGGLFWASEGRNAGSMNDRELPRIVLGNSARAEMLSELAVDPMIFAAADAKGFSGPGWLEPEPWNYHYDGLVMRPRYMRYAEASRILKEPARKTPVHNVAAASFFASEQSRADLVEPWSPPESRLRIEGPLTARSILEPVALPLQQGSDVIGSSVVEAGVNPDGLVVSARLVGRSQSKTADHEALRIARKMRFSPARGEGLEVTWGKLIFQWFAVELVRTNGAPR